MTTFRKAELPEKGIALRGAGRQPITAQLDGVETDDGREAKLQAAIVNDPDNPEITPAEFATMRPASEVLPPALYAALTRPRRQPKP